MDLPFNFSLLISASRRAGARHEVVVAGELEQAGVKLYDGAAAVEHGAAEIVVDQVAGRTVPCPEHSEVRLMLMQSTTTDFDDLALFRARLRDVCEVLGGLSGVLTGPLLGGVDWLWPPVDWA